MGVAVILLAGCGSGGPVVPGGTGTGSGWPLPTSTELAAPTRPTAEELAAVARTRGPVAAVAAIIALTGLALTRLWSHPAPGHSVAACLPTPGFGLAPKERG